MANADAISATPAILATRSTLTDSTNPVDPGVCVPAGHHEETLTEMLDEIIAWSVALKSVREPVPA
jgi:hypothetical protein